MRPLLAVVAEEREGGVVLGGEELERGRVLEGPDVVLLVEAEGERALEAVQVGHGRLHELAAGLAAEEEGYLGVFGDLGLALVHCALGAGVAGGAVRGY